jgi:hypothetical protein
MMSSNGVSTIEPVALKMGKMNLKVDLKENSPKH